MAWSYEKWSHIKIFENNLGICNMINEQVIKWNKSQKAIKKLNIVATIDKILCRTN